jgi:hypothetical protein
MCKADVTRALSQLFRIGLVASVSCSGAPNSLSGPDGGTSGGSGGAGGTSSTPPTSGDPCPTTGNAFDVIQARIFDGHSCSAPACHGSAASGGLELTSGASHASLVGVASQNSALPRVTAGEPDRSFLFHKLEAATNPGSVSIAGSPMPVGTAALTAAELGAVKAWIAAGAPATGAVAGPSGSSVTGDYVAATLCAGTSPSGGSPNKDNADLAPPAPELGVQFTMPGRSMEAGAEWEGCFATYYDYTDRVPDEYKSPDGKSFYVKSTEIRLTQGGHHLAIIDTPLTTADLKDPTFGEWTCNGGANAGGACDPADTTACGADGICMSTAKPSLGCIGYGPPSAQINPAGFGLGTALQATQIVPPIDGVYREVPLKSVLFWDFHAFNLSKSERTMKGRMNLMFAEDRRLLEQRLTIAGGLDGPNAVPPFKKQELCNLWTVPKGSRILRMTSHTHKRGKDFRVWDPSGKQIYRSLDYTSPEYVTFTPPLAFDSNTDAERTIKFCVVYNNGITERGTPDYDLLTQVSLTPDYEIFKPTAVACSKGKWGTPCLPLFGDAQCDSTLGAGDGKCDAANIHFGMTTASEMFFFFPDIVNANTSGSALGESYIWATPLPNVDVK